MSRRFFLVAGLVGLQAMALVVVLGITYWASQDVLLRYAEELAQRISRDTTAYTEEFLDPANDAAQLSDRLSEGAVLYVEDRDLLARYFFEVLRSQSNFAGVYFGSQDGEFLMVSRAEADAEGPFQLKTVETDPEREVRLTWLTETFRRVAETPLPDDDFDPRARPWYIAALEEDGLAWTEPYIFFTSKKPGITVAVPVDDPSTGIRLGAVGVDIGIEALSAFLEGLDISPRGSAAIVDETGDIIAHREESLVAVTEGDGRVRFNTVEEGEDPILTRAAAAVEGGLFPGEIRLARFSAEGETWMAAVQRLSLARSPWTVITYLPESDILAPLYRVRNIAIMVAAAALVATAALGLLYGRVVMRV